MPTRTENGSAPAATGSQTHQTTQRISELAHDAVDRIAEQVELAETRLRTATGSAEARLAESRERVRAQSERLTGTLSTYVQDHPLAALGIAFGAGALVATMLRRD